MTASAAGTSGERQTLPGNKVSAASREAEVVEPPAATDVLAMAMRMSEEWVTVGPAADCYAIVRSSRMNGKNEVPPSAQSARERFMTFHFKAQFGSGEASPPARLANAGTIELAA